jgi:hypothetical protein
VGAALFAGGYWGNASATQQAASRSRQVDMGGDKDRLSGSGSFHRR